MTRQILYVQYTNPANYPPLEHSGSILTNAGWDVRYFGTKSEGESNSLVFSELLAKRVKLWKYQIPGLRQKLHFLAFIVASFWEAWRQRPAWVYCSDLMSCPAAWLIRHLTQCRVLYHEHDSPNKEQRGPLTKFQRFLLWIRKRAAREVDLVVLPNQKRLELFQQTTGRQKASLCVFNCLRLDEVRPQETQRSSKGRLRLVFHGSINRDRLPMALLPALAKLQGKAKLQIAGYSTVGRSNYLTEFLGEARRLGVGDAVEYCGALPHRRDLLSSAAKCDVGLAFMPIQSGDINMANMTGASNKPFDYLACGLALLVSARPDWEEMFVQPGYGLSCDPDDAASLSQQLRWFLEHPQEMREMGERGRERVLEDWNYDKQFASVLAKLES